MNDSKRNFKEIRIGFQNETINSCVNFDELFKIIEDPDKKKNIDKCLSSSSKLFSH
ncbi:MAG: hypothetical protein ACFFDK_15875 [Promethearchaeota archaeon]